MCSYIGSLVGDFHRTLLYGGIYGYPGDTKNKNGEWRKECRSGGAKGGGGGGVAEVPAGQVAGLEGEAQC